MKTETVDVFDLVDGDKVYLLDNVYKVTYLEYTDCNLSRYLEITADGDDSHIELSKLTRGTTFEKVVDDPEDFTVRSVAVAEGYWVEFQNENPYREGSVRLIAYKCGGVAVTMNVDKADLKAVVEKL